MVKNRIVRDTLLLTLMQLALDSAGLLLNSFITRRLGASAVGIFTLTGSFLGFAGILSNGNAFLCTSRLISEELGKKNGCPNRILLHGIALCLMLCTVVSGLMIIFSEPICVGFFGGTDALSAIRIMPAALYSGAVSGCLKGYFNACRKPSLPAVGDILEFAVRSAVIAAMTLFGSVPSQGAVCRIMMISVIAGNMTSLIFMGILYMKEDRRCRSRGTLTFLQYASFAFPIMGGGILTSLLSSTNDALVPVCLRQYGDSFEEAMALFGIFEAIVIPAVFFPSVVLCSLSGMIVTEAARSAAAGNIGRIRSITSRLIRYTMIYSIFAAAVLIRFGRPLGELLGGGAEGGRMISAIAPVVPFIYMEIVLEAMIKGLGLQGFSSLNYLAEYVIRISAVLILVPELGFAGIAASYYASNIFGNISRLVKLLRCTGVKFRPLSMMISPAVYAFLTMASAELICRIFSIKCETWGAMIFFGIIWLAGYGGVFLLSHRLTSNRDSEENAIMQNAQRNINIVM